METEDPRGPEGVATGVGTLEVPQRYLFTTVKTKMRGSRRTLSRRSFTLGNTSRESFRHH